MYTLHITGVALSRGDDAYLGTELDQCPYNRNHFWCSSLGQWQEIFICNLVHTFLQYFCMCATGKSVLSPAIHISVNMLIRFRYILIHFFYVSRATFVGFAYGIGTIASSSIIVPMASLHKQYYRRFTLAHYQELTKVNIHNTLNSHPCKILHKFRLFSPQPYQSYSQYQCPLLLRPCIFCSLLQFFIFLFFSYYHMENEVKDDYLVLTCEKQNVESWTHGLQNISCNELETILYLMVTTCQIQSCCFENKHKKLYQ